jgi:hypothetical protein
MYFLLSCVVTSDVYSPGVLNKYEHNYDVLSMVRFLFYFFEALVTLKLLQQSARNHETNT